jgi:hypothetical protein
MAVSRDLVIVSRMSVKYASHPFANTEHSEKNLLKSESSAQPLYRDVHLLFAIIHDVISDLQVADVLVWRALANKADICDDIPAAVHDCSIRGSYTSDTSSAVQPETRAIHFFDAHTYRSPGSVGAFFNSRDEMLNRADVPTETARIPASLGSPASAVPQY